MDTLNINLSRNSFTFTDKIVSENSEVIAQARQYYNGVPQHMGCAKWKGVFEHEQNADSGPKVIKLFSCSTQISMKFVLLINPKLLTILNSFLLNIAEHENFSANKYENANLAEHENFSAKKYENANLSWHFHIY